MAWCNSSESAAECMPHILARTEGAWYCEKCIRGIIEYEAVAKKSFLVSWNMQEHRLKICDALAGSQQFSKSHMELQITGKQNEVLLKIPSKKHCYKSVVMMQTLPTCLVLSSQAGCKNVSIRKCAMITKKTRATVTSFPILTQPCTGEEALWHHLSVSSPGYRKHLVLPLMILQSTKALNSVTWKNPCSIPENACCFHCDCCYLAVQIFQPRWAYSWML